MDFLFLSRRIFHGWLHFAGTYDKASGKAFLYINGEVVREENIANPQDIAGDWGQGARVGYNIDNARPFTGLMDMFWLFKRALAQGDIEKAMQGEAYPFALSGCAQINATLFFCGEWCNSIHREIRDVS